MSRPIIAKVDAGVAVPFLMNYCRQWNVPIDNPERAEDIWWFGCFHGGRMRAVMGLQLVADDTMMVWGFFGDSSGTYAEQRALAHLTKLIDMLPYKLDGVILLENERMRRHARKHGWKFGSFQRPSNGRPQWRWTRPNLGEVREAMGT